MPDEGDRYMMICSPAMCLCQTVMSTLGNQNMTSILQVIESIYKLICGKLDNLNELCFR